MKVSSTLAGAAPTGHQSALTHSLGGAFHALRRGAPLRPGFAGAAAGLLASALAAMLYALHSDHPVQELLNQRGKLCRESFGCLARARKIGSDHDVILGCKRDPEQAANASA